jgi:hypothetical protein
MCYYLIKGQKLCDEPEANAICIGLASYERSNWIHPNGTWTYLFQCPKCKGVWLEEKSEPIR